MGWCVWCVGVGMCVGDHWTTWVGMCCWGGGDEGMCIGEDVLYINHPPIPTHPIHTHYTHPPIPTPLFTHTQAPKLVLVFVVGGSTYEEAKAVAELNAAGERGEGWSAGMRILLGGSAVLNSRGFIKELLTVGDNERYQSH